MEKSHAIQRLIEDFASYTEAKQERQKNTAEKIHVDEIASKVAAFYEKIRNLIDYREEHLLRKAIIERILRRRILLKSFDKNFAEPLIKELIRSGHLPNDSVPETEVPGVQKIIDNFIYLLENGVFSNEVERNEVSEWLVSITVVAIEEQLFPPRKEEMLSTAMFSAMRSKLEVRNVQLSDDEKDVYLFIAVQRALFRPDNDQLQYRLLKFINPDWGIQGSEAPEGLLATKNALKAYLKSPVGRYFFRLCNKQKVVFLLIGDLVFGGIPLDENLEVFLKSAYQERYKKEKGQFKRLAIFSVISFFISKVLVAFAIEVPIDRYFHHAIAMQTILINVALPPLLMILILLFIKLPSKQNYFLVATEVKNVVFPGEHGHKNYVVAVPKGRSFASEAVLQLAYVITLVVIVYYVTRGLVFIDFSPASIVIFLLFTSMVIATGVRINNRAKEMSMVKEKATMVSFVGDLIAVPFVTIGRYAISGLGKFNILVIIFNFLIELPFQLFIEFLENFRGFIKAKKEETD